MSRLTVSIVLHRSPLPVLERTLTSLQRACAQAQAAGCLTEAVVVLVDNASGSSYLAALCALVARQRQAGLDCHILALPDNGGYGRGHNAVAAETDDFRLVLNPDVLLEADALRQALVFLHRHPEVGLVAPWGQNAAGQPSWLCKAYPGVLTLALRVAPKGLQRLGRVELANYEMRERDWSQTIFDPGLVSGCCLLLRATLWRRLGGFDPGYFLYFEDFDLALRARRLTTIAYLPQFRITAPQNLRKPVRN